MAKRDSLVEERKTIIGSMWIEEEMEFFVL